MRKRDFLKNLSGLAFIPNFLPFELSLDELKSTIEVKKTVKTDFWDKIRMDYLLKNDYVNLENGYYNIIPRPTLNKYFEHIKKVNFHGSYYMRNKREKDNLRIVKRLSQFVGCNSDQLVITRNTTESLDLVISGFPWKKNDEAIFADQDYGAMKQMFKQISARYGIHNKIISIPNHPLDDDEIVSIYENQITARTKLIMVSHMINITGQILPVKKICDMAHKYNVEVLVDGAHCIGHFSFNISDLNCDYYGSSLHKWLSTPLGVGLLYVSKKNISKIWPLIASHISEKNNIMRLNHIGTHPVHTDLAIDNALDYIEIIGIKRKENRLRKLQRYWSDSLRSNKKVIVNTPIEIQRSCGIGNIGISGLKPLEFQKILFDKYNIFTVAIDEANVFGCRITPNVYTSFNELNKFIEAVNKITLKV